MNFKIYNIWNNSANRTKLVIKNAILSICLKFVSIVVSFLIVPLTIKYVDATQYGIWMTISSIVAWTNFFDLGLANGFKNRFAEAIAHDDIELARDYVSTTYILISLIMFVVLSFILIINDFIDWSNLINVSSSYRKTLHNVFAILSVFFCMNMIANIFAKLLEGDQRPALASLINGIGQLFSLIVIFILVNVSHGDLTKLALYFSGIPFATMAIASIIMFYFTRYRIYRPSLKRWRPSLIKNIMGLGVKFFAIYLCLIAVFQLMNIVISREVGSLAVTEYNVANRYFNVAYMFIMILINPMWIAFTDAYHKNDFAWMKNMVSKFEKILLICILGICVMAIISPAIYRLWIGNEVSVPFKLSLCTAVLICAQTAGGVFMSFINGIGTLRIQFLIYLFFAFISYPLMSLSCKYFGVIGITFIPTIVYICQALAARIQIWKIINRTASGVWLK